MSAAQREDVSVRSGGVPPLASEAARKRAAVELIRRHERTLRRTARRYSLCGDDAEDAYQRAVEILLTKSLPSDRRHLPAWMQVVTRREALAVRRSRERLLGPSSDDHGDSLDKVACDRPDPQERLERREQVTDAVRMLLELKPQERLALVLQAHGYSYAEIREICGWTYRKTNRC